MKLCLKTENFVITMNFVHEHVGVYRKIIFVVVTSLTSSVLTLTVISMERFQAVVFPLRRKMSHKAALIVIICSWIVSMGTATPYLFVKQQVEREYLNTVQIRCKENWPTYYTGVVENR